jgi:hypothetical protein
VLPADRGDELSVTVALTADPLLEQLTEVVLKFPEQDIEVGSVIVEGNVKRIISVLLIEIVEVTEMR